uniref:Ig-like domain-containing protein n=1 Tax=Gopherus evgoodei TaxID=1825980 RepID=A0A8C4YTC9_9SAUR
QVPCRVNAGEQTGDGEQRLRWAIDMEPGPRLPQFIAAGYVDGQLIIDYTTKTKNAEPRTEWMARNLDPTYWDQETRIFQVNKARFRDAVETLRNRYNQSKGFHTWQFMAGCELLDGRSTGGYWQYGYDGRDFISLDKETLTWTAADTGAQVTKGKWEADRSLAEYGKWYLEQNCVEELRKYLEYGKETLQRKETPEVKVLAKAAPEGPTTLSCRAHGFYPRNIAVTWVKDGETRDQETQRGGIVPNEDGTYYTWAATEVDPKETDLYTCRVEHESLRKPRDFFWVKDSECRCVCCVSGGEEKEATPGVGKQRWNCTQKGEGCWKSCKGAPPAGGGVSCSCHTDGVCDTGILQPQLPAC